MSPRSEPTDDYESKAMPVSGTVLHRDKHVARSAVFAMVPMALIALLATIGVASGADPAAPRALALLPFLWFAWTMWMVLTKVSVRTVVTSDEVQVHWGFSAAKIPLAAITLCEARPVQTGGLPVAALAASMWAKNGTVLIRWRDAGGKERTAQFGADDPTTLAAQINSARGRTVERSAIRVEGAADARADGIAAGDAGAGAQKSSSVR